MSGQEGSLAGDPEGASVHSVGVNVCSQSASFNSTEVLYSAFRSTRMTSRVLKTFVISSFFLLVSHFVVYLYNLEYKRWLKAEWNHLRFGRWIVLSVIYT